MAPIDEPASFEPKAPGAEGRRARSKGAAPEPPAAPAELVAVTVDVANGRIVMIEGVDGAGARHELSEDERGRLASSQAKATLERVIEQAFQAGIDCVLGEEADETEPPEDAELSRVLLRSLIERSEVKRLMQRDVLSRAIVGTLIEGAASGGATTPH
jgi:hypothetical protein